MSATEVWPQDPISHPQRKADSLAARLLAQAYSTLGACWNDGIKTRAQRSASALAAVPRA